MIASLNGLVLTRTPAAVILDVHGVGYEVFISSRTYDTLPATGAPCVLHVQTVVREDAITLYGFARPEEKELFLLLVTVSGIGPKLALTILSGIGAADLRQAIMRKDLARLTARVLGAPEVEILGRPDPGWNPGRYVPSTALIRRELGVRPTVALDEAIRRTAFSHGFSHG